MANRTAVIQTNKGTIRFELLEEDAPKTTENFITLAERGYYDGIIFHRVISGFMIQGGDPTGTFLSCTSIIRCHQATAFLGASPKART